MLFSLAVTANTQSKISPPDKFNCLISLKTFRGVVVVGFIFSISLHSHRSRHMSAASSTERGYSTLFGFLTIAKNSYSI